MTSFTNLICAIFKSDGISNFIAKTDSHFLGHSLGDGHGCNAPWLCATDQAVVCVAILMQVLKQINHVTCHQLCCRATRTTMLTWHIPHICNTACDALTSTMNSSLQYQLKVIRLSFPKSGRGGIWRDLY